jgi:hypothetical protein
MRPFALVVLVAVLAAGGFALAACGGEDSATPATTTGPAPTTPSTETAPTTTTAPDARLSLRVYFLRDGKVAPAGRSLPRTQAVAAAALNALVAGPTSEEREAGLTTSVAGGAGFSGLRIADGVATVEEDAALSRAAQAQVVYTLTQFPTVRAVRLERRRLTRAGFEEQTPPILVESPTPGDTISSPVRIHGTANTFEATFIVKLLLNAAGQTAFQHFVTATSGSGTRGTFDVTIPFTVRGEGPATLVAFEESAADGRPIHTVEIPVSIRS